MNSFIRIYQRLFYSPTKTKVVILGFQKSGTTAIATLLSMASGLRLSSDPLFLADYGKGEQASLLLSHSKPLGRIFIEYPKLFGSSIIKEPDFIYAFSEVSRVYNNARFLFVVRDPIDIIKSICGRLGIASDELNGIPASSCIKGNQHWQAILTGMLPNTGECSQESFIVNLARRWQLSIDIYLKNADKMLLCRYEDFLESKEKVILEIANKLGLKNKKSIRDHVDTSYQLSGNIKKSRAEFFGERVISEIEDICASGMETLGYVK